MCLIQDRCGCGQIGIVSVISLLKIHHLSRLIIYPAFHKTSENPYENLSMKNVVSSMEIDYEIVVIDRKEDT